MTASKIRPRSSPSGHRTERRISGWRKNFFSSHAPVKLAPGAAGAMFFLAAWEQGLPRSVRLLDISEEEESNGPNAVLVRLWPDASDAVFYVVVFAPLALYCLALTPLVAWSVPGFLAAGMGACIIWYLTFTRMCASYTQFYLYRPNPYVDMYDDPTSRHWLEPITGSPRT